MKTPRIAPVLTAPEAFAARREPRQSTKDLLAFIEWLLRQRAVRLNTRAAR
jgi:hypothetical protein